MSDISIFSPEFQKEHRPPSLLSFRHLAEEAETYGYSVSLSYKGALIESEGETRLKLGNFSSRDGRALSPLEKFEYQKYLNKLTGWLVHIVICHREKNNES